MDTEKEISLYDIINVFRKNKKLFYWVFIGVFVLGVLIILLTPKQYSFTQSIRFAGTVQPNGYRIPLINFKTFLAKSSNIYLPQEINKMRDKDPDTKVEFRMLRIRPFGTDGLFLVAYGTKKSKADYITLFNNLIADWTHELEPEIQLQKQYLTNLNVSLQQELALQKIYQGQNEQLKLKKIILAKNVTNASSYMADNIFQQNAVFNDQKIHTLELESIATKIRLNNLHNMLIDSPVVARQLKWGATVTSLLLLYTLAGLVLAIIAVFVKELFAKMKAK